MQIANVQVTSSDKVKYKKNEWPLHCTEGDWQLWLTLHKVYQVNSKYADYTSNFTTI